jgi:hypothetical protein
VQQFSGTRAQRPAVEMNVRRVSHLVAIIRK